MAVTRKDLGIATAYGYAKSKGYTGTEEEFALLMKSYTDVAEEAREAADDAEDARDAITAMGVSCETLEPGSPATVQKIVDGLGTVTLKFGIPEGADGDVTGDVIADEYSASKTYAVGDHVMKSGHYYVCKTAITTAEAWTAAHWTEVAVGDEVTDLKSHINSLWVTDTASGAIASFPDGANDIPVKDLTVAIEPVQDLHGQSSPYPAGGGVNKCYDAASHLFPRGDGLTIVENADTFTAYAKVSKNTDCVFSCATSPYRTIAFGFESVPAVGVTCHQLAYTTLTSTSYKFNSGAYEYVGFYYGATGHENTNVMIEEGSSASSYAPYSNICPISGWTGANVVRCGKNLVDPTKLAQGFINASGAVVSTATNRVVLDDYICVKDISNIVCSNSANLQYVVFGYDINKSPVYGSNWKNPAEAVDTSAYSWIKLTFREANNADITPSDVTDLMVVHGSTASTYTPYSGTAYPISWQTEAGTVYGGSDEIVSGALEVTRDIVDLGNLNWTYNSTYNFFAVTLTTASKTNNSILSSRYKAFPSFSDLIADTTTIGIYLSTGSGQSLYVRDTAYTDPTVFKTAMSGTKLCYYLEEPQTYQLTSQELKTLLGQNNIWADTGDTTVEYRADTKLYIQKVLS